MFEIVFGALVSHVEARLRTGGATFRRFYRKNACAADKRENGEKSPQKSSFFGQSAEGFVQICLGQYSSGLLLRQRSSACSGAKKFCLHSVWLGLNSEEEVLRSLLNLNLRVVCDP